MILKTAKKLLHQYNHEFSTTVTLENDLLDLNENAI